MKELRYLNPLFIKYKFHFLFGVVATIIAQYFYLYTPELVGDSIESITNYLKSDSKERIDIKKILFNKFLLILGTTIVAAFFTFLMRQALIVMSRHIEYDLKNEIFEKYESLSQNFYKSNRTGDLMNRISEDVSRVRMYVGPALMHAIITFIRFTLIIIYMIQLSPHLTLITLFPLPILAYTIFKISKEINRRTTVFQENLSNLSSFTQETFSGIRVLKAYSIEDIKQNEFKTISDESKVKSLKLAKIQSLFGPYMLLLIGISNLLIVFFGGMMFINGAIKDISLIAKFILLLNMLVWPVTSIGWVSSLIQEAEASQKRINEFLKTEPEIRNNNLSPMHMEGNVIFKNVSLIYPDTNIKAVDNISFEVKKGETLAIIGQTGSGKSIILSLIARLYDPTSGGIIMNGMKLQDINLKSLRENIGVVPQDAFLFSDTIKNNIKFGNIHANDEEVYLAAKNADVHHNILQFKDQYETLLGERGITLSGGQKQRVSIARALIKNPKMLLFDDCLSAVDTETEEKILNNLKNICKNKTSIIVSQRISSTKNADRIIVLNKGKIEQEGTHNELVNKEGYYKMLYLKQISEKELL